VRAKFSSRIEPFIKRKSAIPITAAGYVAAIVMPAFNPRYAFAAPRTTHMTSPIKSARTENSVIEVSAGTYGLNAEPPLPVDFVSAMILSFFR
jgi:hypothetical protein